MLPKFSPIPCPKGLRNGPCGGTLDGKCEVFVHRDCVWMRIHQERLSEKTDAALSLQAPYNSGLQLPNANKAEALQGRFGGRADSFSESTAMVDMVFGSRFEKLLSRSSIFISCEIQTPRTSKGLPRVLQDIRTLATVADSVAITSNHAGQQTISPRPLIREIVAQGGLPVVTLCGRDYGPDAFLDRLIELRHEGVEATICLSGDWPQKNGNDPDAIAAATDNFYHMDSAQMLFEAKSLRETQASHYGELAGRVAPKIFTGCVINPFSKPLSAVVSRLKQKVACGAKFVMTQAVCDVEAFCLWYKHVSEFLLETKTPVLVSLPLIGNKKGLEILCNLPGVFVPTTVRDRLASATDLVVESERFAEEMFNQISLLAGVRGIHLMTFGFPASRLHVWLERIRNAVR